MKSKIFNLLLLILSLSIGIITSEFLFRIIGYKPYIYKNRLSLSEETFEKFCNAEKISDVLPHEFGLNKPDKDLGYIPGDGFNDTKDFTKKYPNKKRILMLGDSTTYGASADQGKGFIDLLNKAYLQENIIFFNTGVGGYGQNHQLAVLRKYYESIEPNLVILNFQTLNDFIDNIMPLDTWTAFPTEWISNYVVEEKNNSVNIKKRTGEELLGLYKYRIGCTNKINNLPISLKHKIKNQLQKYVIGTRLIELYKENRSIFMSFNTRISSLKESSYSESAFRINTTTKYLELIRDFCVKKNTPFVVAIFPDHLTSSEKGMKKSSQYKDIIKILKKLNIKYVEPIEALDYSDYVGWTGVTFDDHWNNSGHKKVADFYIEKFGKEFDPFL